MNEKKLQDWKKILKCKKDERLTSNVVADYKEP